MDALEMSKDKRKAFYEAQLLLVAVYRNLYDVCPQANLILLHHVDELVHKEPGKEETTFESYVPSTAGSALNRKWGGRFTALLQTERSVNKRVDGGSIAYEHRYHLLLAPTHDSNQLKLRAGLKHTTPPKVEFTTTGDLEPLLHTWDVVFQAIDQANEARRALATGGTR
jgi:hypothetical protein